jgi:hypothetical protein
MPDRLQQLLALIRQQAGGGPQPSPSGLPDFSRPTPLPANDPTPEQQQVLLPEHRRIVDLYRAHRGERGIGGVGAAERIDQALAAPDPEVDWSFMDELRAMGQTPEWITGAAKGFSQDITDPNYRGKLSALPPQLRGLIGGATEGVVQHSNPLGILSLAATGLSGGAAAGASPLARTLLGGADLAVGAGYGLPALEEGNYGQALLGGAGALVGAGTAASGIRELGQAARPWQRLSGDALMDPIVRRFQRLADEGRAARPRPPVGQEGFAQAQARQSGFDFGDPVAGLPESQMADVGNLRAMLERQGRESTTQVSDLERRLQMLGARLRQTDAPDEAVELARARPGQLDLIPQTPEGARPAGLDLDSLPNALRMEIEQIIDPNWTRPARPRMPGRGLAPAVPWEELAPPPAARADPTATAAAELSDLPEYLRPRRVTSPTEKAFLSGESQRNMQEAAKARGTSVEDLNPRQFAERAPDDPRGYEFQPSGTRSRLKALDDAFRRLVDDPSGGVNPDAARRLGEMGLGGSVGAFAGEESSDSPLAPFAGAAAGAAIPFFLRNPQLFEKFGYAGLLGHPSTLTAGHVGAASAGASRGVEELLAGLMGGGRGQAKRGVNVLRNLLSKRAGQSYMKALREGSPDPTEGRWGQTQGMLGLPGRIMSAPDAAVTEAMIDAGIPLASAKQSAFTGIPRSKTGQLVVGSQRKMGPISRTIAFPFARTAANITERGIERTPGLGFLPELFRETKDRATLPEQVARQLLGAGAGGAGYAAASEEGQYPYVLNAAAGPYAVPFALGAALRKLQGDDASMSDVAQAIPSEIAGQSPLPTEAWQIQRMLDPREWLTRMVPRGTQVLPGTTAPGDLEQMDKILGPLFARIPYLNTLLLEKRRQAKKVPRRRPRSRR